MLGEQVREIRVGPLGALGDRSWALRDLESGRIASAKKYPRLLEFRASY
jgi:MOSC N-terminal beta barrel domain